MLRVSRSEKIARSPSTEMPRTKSSGDHGRFFSRIFRTLDRSRIGWARSNTSISRNEFVILAVFYLIRRVVIHSNRLINQKKWAPPGLVEISPNQTPKIAITFNGVSQHLDDAPIHQSKIEPLGWKITKDEFSKEPVE